MATARYPGTDRQSNPQGGGSAQYGNNAIWVPPNLAALPFWLDSTDINLLGNVGIADNDLIGTWKNKGTLGSSADYLQAVGGSKPTFKATAGINGKPSIRWASGKSMAATVSPVAAAAARHIFIAVEFVAAGGVLFGSRAAGSYYITPQAPGGFTQIETNNVDTNNNTNVAHTVGVKIIEMAFSGVTTEKPTYVVNGVAGVVTNGVGTGVGAEGGAAGCHTDDVEDYIGAILVYNAVQSAAVAADVTRGLAQRYRVALP